MNTKKFMEAVGNISDENIAKYAEFSPVIVKGKAEKEVKGMKKLSVWLSAAAAALVLGIGVFATARLIKLPGNGPIAGIPRPVETEAPGNTETVDPVLDAPEQIVFNSLDDYRAFAASIELDDEAFEEFISSNSYDMNGVNTKADAAKVLDALSSMPIPKIDGFKLIRINLKFDSDSVYILYKNESSDGVLLGFEMIITPSNESSEDRANECSFETSALKVEDLQGLNYLLRPVDMESVSGNTNTSYYFTNILAHKARLVSVNMTEETLLSILSDCLYTTIGEYAEE